MKLNLDIICDYLPKSLQVRRLGPIDSSLSLNSPMLYETGIELEIDRLYVARADTLPRTPPKNGLTMVCVDRTLPAEWMDKGCQTLLIANGSSLFFVFNEICKIFEKFNTWEIEMRDELETEDGFDIKRIITAGAEILKNPISVVNGSMLHIFSTEITPKRNNSEISVTICEGCRDENLEGFEKIRDACGLERVIKEPYMSSVTYDGHKYYCNNLYPFGAFAGCIAIRDSNQPFKESDYPLADRFFEYFQKAYAKYLRRTPQFEVTGSFALKNLLEGMPLSSEEHRALELDEGENWTFFKLKSLRKLNHMPMDYMKTTLNTLMPDHIYALIYENELSGILKYNENSNAFNSNVLAAFEKCLSKMGYIAGISSAFNEINHIGIFMKQAVYAVEIGSQMVEKKHLYHFNDYILQYMLTRYNGSFPIEYLYSKGLQSLISHDKINHTEYVKTLDIYLKNEMGITATADELFLHRSSLLGRINKIKKILKTEFDNPDIRLYLRVCLYTLTSDLKQ